MKDAHVLESESMQSETNDEAAAVENENYLKSREARLKLEKAIALQRQITDELEKQGEKIGKIKDSSIKLYKCADASQDVSAKIKDESSIFPSFMSLFKGVKRWWSTNRKMQKDVMRIESRKGRGTERDEVGDVSFELLETEFIPGENRTERELAAILGSIRKVSSEGRNQLELVKVQDEDISDIKRINEYSNSIIDETEKSLRKK